MYVPLLDYFHNVSQSLPYSEFVSILVKNKYSQKDNHTVFSFLFHSVLLSWKRHLKVKLGIYFAQPSFAFSNGVYLGMIFPSMGGVITYTLYYPL